MQSLIRPLLRPIPLISISTGGVLLATSLYGSRAAHTITSPSPPAMTSSTPKSYSVKPYTPRHETWPYKPSDFTRQDESSDTHFYDTPRLVTHIDDLAIESLREYYATVLPTKGRILDFCSSWISHYPDAVADAAEKGEVKVTAMGMNDAELRANKVANGGRVCADLNATPDIPSALSKAGVPTEEGFDASTCVVSVDYLTSPLEVLKSLLSITKPGGTVHLVISNRCFPTKAIGRWLRVSEQERLAMVGDYLHFAGWRGIEIVEVSDGTIEGGRAAPGGLGGLMAYLGMPGGARDPLWVVRGRKEG
ncbi:hypothetical protein B0A48_11429 [Cryoendolithus antarcticus]|uniref:Methyltransferase type 11 domain-containing protein n=1 Tax=Cryoendolithus antarcticus TaxID=1507870 RepID=A0A1V8SVV0_9PEZI|nr:hypothetical protein B0A48_11429 [Cryoendolithus antarcticus]